MAANPELEYQRRHLLEQKTPEGRAMVMAGIDRMLDQMLAYEPIATSLPPSAEGQEHLNRGQGSE